MGTKAELLTLLERHRGEVVSGQQAADGLGVSRASVWKAAESLRKEGHRIDAASGGGYRLLDDSDCLSVEGLRVFLKDSSFPVVVLDECESTNIEAKKLAIEGAPAGTLVMSERQTAGKGRKGRTFESPPGGLYMSTVLRPERDAQEAVLLTAASAVAACRAVSELCGLELQIKWVNDLFYHSKKCCGILCEGGTGLENGQMEYVVSGIGINYTTPPEAFLPEVRGIVTSLYPDGGPPCPRVKLAARIHRYLMEECRRISERRFLEEYKERSLVLGREVVVMTDPPYPARVLEIDQRARLVVETGDGQVKALSSGEVSVRL